MLVPIRESFRITALCDRFLDRVFPPSFVFQGEAHDFWEGVYVHSGRVEITGGDAVFMAGEGDLIFHAPWVFHRIRSADGTSPHVLNFSFRTEGTPPERLTEGILRPDAAAREAIVRLQECIDSPDEEMRAEGAHRLALLIMQLCRAESDRGERSATAPALAYRALIRLMREEVAANLSLGELASRSYLSASYVKALFLRYAGVGPRTYYNNLRLQEACRLLRGGEGVATVSERMRFSSPQNFIRFFKAGMGMTPLEYKRTSVSPPVGN